MTIAWCICIALNSTATMIQNVLRIEFVSFGSLVSPVGIIDIFMRKYSKHTHKPFHTVYSFFLEWTLSLYLAHYFSLRVCLEMNVYVIFTESMYVIWLFGVPCSPFSFSIEIIRCARKYDGFSFSWMFFVFSFRNSVWLHSVKITFTHSGGFSSCECSVYEYNDGLEEANLMWWRLKTN